MKDIIIFDIDGTLVESSQKINIMHAEILNKIKKKYEIAICGGGTLTKALEQMNDLIYFDHYFTECGCVYNKNKSENSIDLEEIYVKNLRVHNLYQSINILIKEFLKYLSNVNYELSGHFVDLRNGIVYLSCVGMQANNIERERFKCIDKNQNIRTEILINLRNKANELGILDKLSINLGGSVGIGIYPIEYDKTQILDIIDKNKYNKIIYFGDKYLEDGNDYGIINHKNVIGYKIDNVEDTFKILKYLLENNN